MGEPMMDYDDLKDKDFCPTDSCPCYDKMWSEIEHLREENERLKEKCNKQAMILRRFSPENYPDTFFIAGFIGEKDQNGLPKYIEVCPAYGVDWVQLYERTDRTIGGMGS